MRGKNRYTALRVALCVLGGIIGAWAGMVLGDRALDWALGDRRANANAVILLLLGILVARVGGGFIGMCLGAGIPFWLTSRLGN